ncbi:MAG: hypothetical protein H7Z41_03400, partial [Cytophagales bacterium]|nr:hypothetical protein [Armatimonadota bacterium]
MQIISFLSKALPISAALVLTASSSLPAAAPAPVSAQGGPLLTFDFNGSGRAAWPGAAPKPVGTIDVAGTTTPSGAMQSANGTLTSGLLPLRNRETNLGKLTLSFDHSVSSVRPVTVQIESFDAKKKRTG